MTTRILFVEPPKDYWFLMGEYLPPPTGLLALAAFLERELKEVEIEILDCQAEGKNWKDVEKAINSYSPNVVASSGFTCNAYACAKLSEIVKTIDSDISTIVGGQHFSFTDEESLLSFPEIDYIVRGEGEQTLVDLVRALRTGGNALHVRGLSFRNNGNVIRTPPRNLVEDLDSLPYPAYHLVEKYLDKYHFTMMAGKTRYLIIEGSRGCNHRCRFCTQWKHWNGTWRTKSASRIADEMSNLRDNFGAGFIWLTDDNFEYKSRGGELAQMLKQRGFGDSVPWFFQSRTDDIVQNPDIVAKLHNVGNNWQLVGVENNSPQVLSDYRKGERVEDAVQAVRVLKQNGIFAQTMMVIGSRRDTAESIQNLREFTLELDPDMAIFSILTPLPGTDIHEEAKQNGWIEDMNYAHYDMAHAIMPTETLSRSDVQQELLRCYKSFFGSPVSILRGLFSGNEIKKRCYRHLAGKRVLGTLRQLV